MKTRIWGILCAVPFMVVGWASASASTILAATDGDVNFFLDELGGAQLAMFEDGDFGGDALAIPLPSAIGIAGPFVGPSDTNYIATNQLLDSIFLFDNPWFVLGVSTDGGATWISDSGVTELGANAYRVFFQLDGPGAGSVVSADVQVVQTVQAVPVPAAAWLFGSGLLGLVGIARRHEKQRCRMQLAQL